MFPASDLLGRNLVVFRATVAPNPYLRLLGERGVEIGRVVEEETGLQDGPVWLAVYDREKEAPVRKSSKSALDILRLTHLNTLRAELVAAIAALRSEA